MNTTDVVNPVVVALDRVREVLGSYEAMGRACRPDKPLTGKAVEKWRKTGRLPRTEYTGETQYAAHLVKATGGAVSREDLCPPVALHVTIE